MQLRPPGAAGDRALDRVGARLPGAQRTLIFLSDIVERGFIEERAHPVDLQPAVFQFGNGSGLSWIAGKLQDAGARSAGIPVNRRQAGWRFTAACLPRLSGARS
jgi:hypothetical protein